jgi:hypothetical protein
MFLIAIIWGVIVSNLAVTTQVRHDCMDKVCEIKIKPIGYEIVKSDLEKGK